MYSEVKEQQNCDEVPCMEYENENPLYESAASDDILMVNPIYDRFVVRYYMYVYFPITYRRILGLAKKILL